MWGYRFTVLAAVLFVTACALGPPVTQLSVASGTVTIAAPNGYCIDRSATRDRAQGTFLLLGSCAALSSTGAAATVPVVLTALVSEPLQTAAPPDPASLERYFRSTSGRASLARDGRAQSVTILQSQTRSGVLYLKMRDTSPEEGAALTPDIWRAFLPVSDRLTVLSVRTLKAQPVSSDAPLSVLRKFVSAVQNSNTPVPQ